MKLCDNGNTQLRASRNAVLPALGPFAELDGAARARLAGAGRRIERRLGDYLAIQGQPHHALSLILSGRVAITAHAHGDTIDLATIGAGDVIGEMSVIDPHLASATARVVAGPAWLWVIDGVAFERFVSENPAAGFVLMKGLAKVLCRRVRADSDHMLRRAEELRAHFLDNDY